MKLTSYTAKEKKGKQSRAEGWQGKKLRGNVTLNPKKICYRCKPGRLTVLPLCILCIIYQKTAQIHCSLKRGVYLEPFSMKNRLY